MLFIHAIRTGDVPDRLSAFQSDYVATWDKSAPAGSPGSQTEPRPSVFKSLVRAALSRMPGSWERAIRSRYEAVRFYSPAAHPNFFKAPPHYFSDDWIDHLDD